MRTKAVRILGKKWTCYFMSEKEFLDADPSCHDAGAYALSHTRQIRFLDSEFSLGVVRHETRHAFTAELCLESANLSALNMEEVQCTLDQRHWDCMNKVALEIFKAFSPKKKGKAASETPTFKIRDC